MILPHSAHFGISAYLKFLQFSACKMGYEVALLSLRPAGRPAGQPSTYLYKLVYLSNQQSDLAQI